MSEEFAVVRRSAPPNVKDNHVYVIIHTPTGEPLRGICYSTADKAFDQISELRSLRFELDRLDALSKEQK